MSYLRKLYALKDSEGNLPFDTCQKINIELASTEVSEIPIDQHQNVEEYISKSLALESVNPELIGDLEKLLSELNKNK